MHLKFTPDSRTAICKVVFVGTYLLIAGIASLLFISLVAYHHAHVLPRLLYCGTALAYITLALFLLQHHYKLAVHMLLGFYILLASGIVWTWGIHTPIAPLLFGLVIVLAGILLTARCGLWAAVLSTTILTAVQAAAALGWHAPYTAWAHAQPSFGDVLAYAIVFSMLALVSWLYKRSMNASLDKATQAEAALRHQKATLEIEVKKRTAQLRKAQLEEMRQMYRFAEFGQLGASLLHDLANYLSVLVLEIEGLQNTRHSADIDGARQAIRYLEDLVDSTRQKLNGKTLRKRFDIGKEITTTLAFLRYKAAKGNTSIDWEPPLKPLHYLGDPTCLAQVITVITSNAIESYALSGASAGQRRIEVVLRRDTAGPTIVISNWGKPIPHKERASLFIPFHSTKKRGMGLGLFMAKQIIEMNFSGTLTLNPNTDHTEFSITLPAAHEK